MLSISVDAMSDTKGRDRRSINDVPGGGLGMLVDPKELNIVSIG
jgi:hypothetical protein